jgi:hypothetical protein
MIEMDEDSLWVATNTRAINCLVKGKMKRLLLKDSMTPVINYLYRDEKENLYAASDHVLFIFHENNFTKLPFTNSGKRDIIKAPDGRIRVSTNETIKAINSNELKKGKFVFEPARYL